jgi:uncharacterized FAD-dependent dehydrogenase
MNIFDIGIVGAGVSGTFAALKLTKKHKNKKIVLFEIGRGPAKRRQQMNGYLGCFPNSDGKLYLNDIDKVEEICGKTKTKKAYNWFLNYVKNILNTDVVKDILPSKSLVKKIKNNEFNLQLNNYIQVIPKEIHLLSRKITSDLQSYKNIQFNFDDEVFEIRKDKKYFIITSQTGEYICKKLLINVGRSGWRWVSNLYESFGIIENNDLIKFGVRIEIPNTSMKDFNNSNCTLTYDNLEIGPLCWNGTVIPEDHLDFAISAFRSNEGRWQSDNVSFNLINNISTKNNGWQQTDRLGQLTFILTNERVAKEKISSFLSKKSKVSIIPEYDQMIDSINKLSTIIPDIINKGYLHIPTITPLPPKIRLGTNLLTEVENMYCAGESCGIVGILAAALTGIIAADSM